MSDKIKEFTFNLNESIEYAHNGEQVETSFIVFTAPTSRHRKDCAFLKQAFFRVMKGMQSDVKDVATKASKVSKSDVEFKAEDIMMFLAMGDDSLSDVWDVAINMFCRGVAKLGGESVLTKALVEKIDMDDLDSMVGEYLVNFTLRSSLTTLK